jgi:hypothetical protein
MLLTRTNLETLPASPSPKVTEKYSFLDTRKVVDDMRDLGFEVAEVTRPKFRTRSGAFGLHQVELRRVSDVKSGRPEIPRVLFVNSYDGSRKAEFISGVIRFACLNGLVIGDGIERQKFVHLGEDREETILTYVKEMAETFDKTWTTIDAYQGLRLDDKLYLEMAREAHALRYPDEDARLDIDPSVLLMPRRREDNRADLYTTWNVLQENLIKGGVPGRTPSGSVRRSSGVSHIERTNKLNRELWNLMDRYAAMA